MTIRSSFSDRVSQPIASFMQLRSSRVAMIAAIVASVVILGATTADLYSRYQSILVDSELRVRGYNNMLAEQVSRSFEAIDRILMAAADAHDDFHATGPNAQPLPPHETLRSILHGTPLLLGMSWVDADGNRTHGSPGPNLPALNVGMQEQFTVHRDSPLTGLFLSHPFRSIIDNRWLVAVSRRLNQPNGAFAGVVQATLDINYLDRTYGQMSTGDGMTIGLYRDDGTILIRTPETFKFIGQSVAGGPQFNTIFRGEGQGVIRGVNVRDGPQGPERLVSFRAIPDLPLVVVVSIRLDEALKRWQTSLNVMAPLAVLLSLLVLGGGFLFARQLAHNERQRLSLLEATERAEAAHARAVRASQAKSTFLASMSHELRTPLNAVIGYGQILQLDQTASKAQHDYAETILKGGYHLLDVINQVLDMAGIESGKLKVTLEPIVPAKKLSSIHQTLAPIAERKNITIDVVIGPAVPPVLGDLMRLRQVLLNLAGNAIKYNRKGGWVRMTAEKTAYPGDGAGRVRFTVQDNGPGIAAERQAEIFQPFSRLGAEFTAVEGTGLGLAISKQLVEAMDGTIGFESTPDTGTTFWFELPVAQQTVNTETAPQAAPADPTAPVATRSILYVEDVPENLRLLTLLCATRPGLTVLPATLPEEGLYLAAAHRPDIIILDLNLPGMSGYEMLERLKAMPETKDIPIMALTASAMPEDAKRGLAAGFFRYLTKPINAKTLFLAIDDALAEKATGGKRAGAAA